MGSVAAATHIPCPWAQPLDFCRNGPSVNMSQSEKARSTGLRTTAIALQEIHILSNRCAAVDLSHNVDLQGTLVTCGRAHLKPGM